MAADRVHSWEKFLIRAQFFCRYSEAMTSFHSNVNLQRAGSTAAHRNLHISHHRGSSMGFASSNEHHVHQNPSGFVQSPDQVGRTGGCSCSTRCPISTPGLPQDYPGLSSRTVLRFCGSLAKVQMGSGMKGCIIYSTLLFFRSQGDDNGSKWRIIFQICFGDSKFQIPFAVLSINLLFARIHQGEPIIVKWLFPVAQECSLFVCLFVYPSSSSGWRYGMNENSCRQPN